MEPIEASVVEDSPQMIGLERSRTEKNLTLRELEEKSGVHYMKIHQIEKGKLKIENITLENAIKLSGALGCSPKDLI